MMPSFEVAWLDIVTCIEGRTSTRDFSSEPVDDEVIDEALRMANLAPSAGNLQSRDFVVVKDQRTKELLAEAALGQRFVAQAPVVVVFCANLERVRHYGERGRTLYCLQDVAAAVENMLLYLHSRGLGSVWVGAFDERKVAQALGLPAHARPVAMVPIGFPARRQASRRSRLPLDQLVHREKW